MKLRDIEKYIQCKKQMSDFFNEEKKYKICLVEADFTQPIVADNLKDLFKQFSEEYYGELTKDTEVVNENDNMTIYVSYQAKNWNIEEQKMEYKEETVKYHLWIKEV